MRSLGKEFCPVCREAIVKEIYACSQLSYSFDQFLLKDQENLTAEFNSYRTDIKYPDMIPDDLRYIKK